MPDQHGQDAGLLAAMRADEVEAARDEAGRRTRMRILATIDGLARTERRRHDARTRLMTPEGPSK